MWVLSALDVTFYVREKYNTTEKCVTPLDGDVNLKNINLRIY
jgi:hypothetical protein